MAKPRRSDSHVNHLGVPESSFATHREGFIEQRRKTADKRVKDKLQVRASFASPTTNVLRVNVRRKSSKRSMALVGPDRTAAKPLAALVNANALGVLRHGRNE
jgi:hypothetical protein